MRAKEDRISDALLEAQACAERMRMETQAREQVAQEAVRKTLSAEMAELDRSGPRSPICGAICSRPCRSFPRPQTAWNRRPQS